MLSLLIALMHRLDTRVMPRSGFKWSQMNRRPPEQIAAIEKLIDFGDGCAYLLHAVDYMRQKGCCVIFSHRDP